MMKSGLRTMLGLAGLGLVACSLPATAADVTIGDLVISHPWTRVTPPGAKVAGGYVTITNKGKATDHLVGGTAAIADHIEVHEMSMDGGVMKMRELKDGLEIKPGATVELKPGGYHVMFMGLKSGPVEGTPVKGTLKFKKAGEAEVAYDVAPLGAKSAGGMDHGTMNHGTMDHSKMDHGNMNHDMKMPEGQHGKH